MPRRRRIAANKAHFIYQLINLQNNQPWRKPMKIFLVTSFLYLSLVSSFSQAVELSKADENILIRDANAALAQKDYASAFTKYSTLAEHGMPLAQYNLGTFYLNGLGVQKNEKLAFEWFRKSAEQGNSRAMQVIEKAAAQGNVYAKNELRKLSGQPEEVQPQPQQQQQARVQPRRNARADSGMHFLFNMGVTIGGDEIFTAATTTGGDVDVKGGELVQIGMGGLYQFENAPIALALSANYHMDRVTASNGNMTFTRYPIEAMAYYTGANKFRVGGGIRIISASESSATVNSATQKVAFDSTKGYVAELGFKTSPNLWINLRYVS
jgi:hypothetical protein